MKNIQKNVKWQKKKKKTQKIGIFIWISENLRWKIIFQWRHWRRQADDNAQTKMLEGMDRKPKNTKKEIMGKCTSNNQKDYYQKNKKMYSLYSLCTEMILIDWIIHSLMLRIHDFSYISMTDINLITFQGIRYQLWLSITWIRCMESGSLLRQLHKSQLYHQIVSCCQVLCQFKFKLRFF